MSHCLYTAVMMMSIKPFNIYFGGSYCSYTRTDSRGKPDCHLLNLEVVARPGLKQAL
jgi:hypothetical protein